MFIRASIQKKKTQAEYKTFKLVESFRTERGPRQRTVLNLGAGFDLPEAQWKDLANRIEEIITRQESMFPCAQEVERLARYRVSDKLLKGRDELEDYLSCQEKTLFNLQETIVLYDLTNTFLEGTGKLNKKAKFAQVQREMF